MTEEFPSFYMWCVACIWKNTVHLVGLEGHATLQMSALPYFADIAFFKL